MNDHFIAPAAVQDLEAIAIWTVEHFGERQLLRYKALISQAIQDVVPNLFVPGAIHVRMWLRTSEAITSP